LYVDLRDEGQHTPYNCRWIVKEDGSIRMQVLDGERRWHNTTKATERKFKCSMRLAMPGPDLYAEDYETDLYKAIDLVAKKIEQQIRKRHSKYKARKHTEAATHKRRRQEAQM